MRVLRDLRQRRVAPKLAEQVTERTFQSTDETELIEAFLKRKFRGKQLGPFLKDPKNLAAAFRRLRYAGFSSGASIRVLKRYSNQAEELEGIENGGRGRVRAHASARLNMQQRHSCRARCCLAAERN